MRVLKPSEIKPVVSVAGYRRTQPDLVLGPRTLPRPEIIYVGDGTLTFKVEGERERRVRRGDVLLIHPGELHTVKAVRNAPPIAGYIHNEPIRSSTWASGAYRIEPAPRRITSTGNDPDMRDLFRRAAEVFRSYTPFRDAILEGIVREIWLRLAQYWSARGEYHLTRRMRRMVGYLRRHLSKSIGRLDLAERFHITPEHVNFLFKKELGTSPTAFVTRERVHLAYNLLHEEDLPVAEVAERVGFNDPFYFSRTFKRVMGIAPSEVR